MNPFWYTPLWLPGRAGDWKVDTEYKTYDVFSNGLFGIPASRFPLATILDDIKYYLTYGEYRWPIIGFGSTYKDEIYNPLAAIHTYEPPPIGWWMPTLEWS